MTGLLQILRGLGFVKLTAIGCVLLITFGFFIYLMLPSSGGNMAVLFSQIDPAEGAKIVDKLESLGIPVDVKGDGTVIYIPADKMPRARMDLAKEGLPSGGAIGYEIFDRQDLLSTSTSLLDINKVRALEGELVKSIKTISGIGAARVHLVIPKRELFSTDKTHPSASIILKMKGGIKPTQTQVYAIQHLVGSAVPGLPTEKISIIDDKGTLLAKGNSESAEGVHGLLVQQEAKSTYETKLAKSIENLVEKIVGEGKVRIEISTEMDFDQITINSEKYDPDGQVVRSINNAQEDSALSDNDQNVSVQNALPQTQSSNTNTKNSNTSKRNEENTNYEISKTIESHRKEIGKVKNTSIAVLVDGTYVKDEKGVVNYTPRQKEDLDQIKILVQTAIGYRAEKGDKVEIINMPFSKVDSLEDSFEKESPSLWDKINTGRLIELVILVGATFLILLMVVRPIVLRVLERGGGAIQNGETQALLESAQNHPILPILENFSETPMALTSEGEEEDVFVDIHNIEGRIRLSSLKKIGDVVDKYPEESVAILRKWMYEDPWKQEKSI